METNNKPKKFTHLTEAQITLIRNWTGTQKDLVVATGKDSETIRRACRKLGITLDRARKPLTENVNHEFFNEWTVESAYVFGYIAADGNIQDKPSGGRLISFGVGEKDKDHLQQVADLMSLKLPLRRYVKPRDGVITYHVCASSPILYDRLVALGMTERKSLTLKWPTSVPKEFIHHMVRGYCDGDGCIKNCELLHRPTNKMRVRLAGTYDFLSGVKAAFSEFSGEDVGSLLEHAPVPGHYNLEYAGNLSAVAFCAWMYAGSTAETRLARKYEVYQKFLTVK